jgi:hypothetical protein
MLCDGGSGPEFCGGVGANAVYTLPAPVAPEDVPEYEYLGRCMLSSSFGFCYQSNNVTIVI